MARCGQTETAHASRNRLYEEEEDAEVETELDRVSSARAYFRPFPSCYALLNSTVRLLQTPPRALGLEVMPSSKAHRAPIPWC